MSIKKMRILESNEVGHGILIENFAQSNSEYSEIFKKELKNINENNSSHKFNPNAELTCILQKYDIQNKNGRIYPKHILEREADKYRKYIQEGTATGELNHPKITELDGDRLSHLITKIWWENRTLVGNIKLLLSEAFINNGIVSTKGDLVATYINNGVKIGVSSRGVGSVQNSGGVNIVQEDFELICWDIVTQPSTPNAWIFTEPNSRKTYVESDNTLNKSLDNFLLS